LQLFEVGRELGLDVAVEHDVLLVLNSTEMLRPTGTFR